MNDEGRPACAEADPHLFFTDAHSEAAIQELTDTARRYCCSCPAITACAAMADRSRMSGLFGGALRREGKTPSGWEKSVRAGCTDYAWIRLIAKAPEPDPVAIESRNKGRWAA